MNTWAPIWSKIVDSSVWDESDLVVRVFLTMLAKKDVDHVVRATAYNIGKWARKSEAEVLEALEILASPDTRRIEPQPYEGRRIEKVEDGWLVLNGEKYRLAVRTLWRREYKREHEQMRRDKKKKASSNIVEAGARVKEQESRDESNGGLVAPAVPVVTLVANRTALGSFLDQEKRGLK